MNRKSLDKIASVIGLILAVVLVGAGALLQWGGNFANGQVKDQLLSQKVTFPDKGSDSLKALPEVDRLAMEKFAGKTMSTGDQAYTYANHYIRVHMQGIGAGKTYEEVSGEWMGATAQLAADPTNKDLAAQVAALGNQRQALFMGSTLMGLLGFTYAFATIAKIAIIGSYLAFAAGGILLILAMLGFRHMRNAEIAA
mgnify:CR=1 FL=1